MEWLSCLDRQAESRGYCVGRAKWEAVGRGGGKSGGMGVRQSADKSVEKTRRLEVVINKTLRVT
jgi:hypothetical protein